MTSTKAIVDWGTACGRTYLEVAGVTVAVEGDPERDGTLGGGNMWTGEKIQEVVRRYAAATGVPLEPATPPDGHGGTGSDDPVRLRGHARADGGRPRGALGRVPRRGAPMLTLTEEMVRTSRLNWSTVIDCMIVRELQAAEAAYAAVASEEEARAVAIGRAVAWAGCCARWGRKHAR